MKTILIIYCLWSLPGAFYSLEILDVSFNPKTPILEKELCISINYILDETCHISLLDVQIQSGDSNLISIYKYSKELNETETYDNTLIKGVIRNENKTTMCFKSLSNEYAQSTYSYGVKDKCGSTEGPERGDNFKIPQIEEKHVTTTIITEIENTKDNGTTDYGDISEQEKNVDVGAIVGAIIPITIVFCIIIGVCLYMRQKKQRAKAQKDKKTEAESQPFTAQEPLSNEKHTKEEEVIEEELQPLKKPERLSEENHTETEIKETDNENFKNQILIVNNVNESQMENTQESNKLEDH